MESLVGQLIGALLASLLFSRVFTWFFWKVIGKNRSSTFLSYAVMAITIIVLAAIGNADGGPLAWEAGLIYMPFCLLFLVLDMRRIVATPSS